MAKKNLPREFPGDAGDKESDALDDFTLLLEKFLDLLEFTLENADKPLKKPISKDVYEQLSDVEGKVETFCQNNEKMVAEINASIDKELLSRYKSEEVIEMKERLFIERSERLKQIISEKRNALAKASGQKLPREEESNIAIPDDPRQREKTGKARKSLFKRIGGKKNWRPM